jgi:hypothetical protein
MAVLKQDDHTAGRDIYGSHGDAWETLRFADPSNPTDSKPADLLYNFIDGTSANNAQDGTNRDDVHRGGFKTIPSTAATAMITCSARTTRIISTARTGTTTATAILIFDFEVILLRYPSGQHGVIEGQGELLARSDEPCRSGRLGLRVSDGSQQGVPVREDDVGGDGAQMLEEAVLGAAGGDDGAPGEDTEIGDGVKREGE